MAAGNELEELNRNHATKAHERSNEFHKTLLNAAIEAGNAAVKSLILVNGGAVVAMLAFVASVYSQQNVSEFDGVIQSLSLFAFGVFAAVVTACGSYLTNYSYSLQHSERLKTWKHPYIDETRASNFWARTAIVFHIISILSGLTSSVLFVCGILKLKDALLPLV